MRKNRIFGMLSATVLLIAGACSNENLGLDGPNGADSEKDGPGVYLAVNFDLPSSKETRSYTNGDNSSSGGVEIGHEYENVVRSVYVVLAKTSDNSLIAAAKSSTIDAVGVSGRSYRNTAKFTKTELAQFYNSTFTEADKAGDNYKVNVFVFANPTEGLSTMLDAAKFGDTNWFNGVGVYKEVENPTVGVIWDKNNFLMSNNAISTRMLPGTLDQWNNHTTAATAFNLCGMNHFGRPDEINNLQYGNVQIERAAARYDFRDGALDGVESEGKDPNYNGFKAQTYHVVLDSENEPLVDVMLGKMSMVNMNQEYYFLRRVSNNGMPTGAGYALVGPELPWYTDATGTPVTGGGNYVVDAFADWKVQTPNKGFSHYFNFPFFNDEGVMDNAETPGDLWYTSLISKVLTEGAADNPDSWNADGEKASYKTWRYLTEGTIPEIRTQQYGISNGIVFKGQLQPAREAVDSDDPFTKKLLETLKISEEGNKLHDAIIYEFGGHVYCTWEHIKRMAIYLSLTDLKFEDNRWVFTINRSSDLYNAVFGTGGFGKISFKCDRNGELKNADFLIDGSETLDDTLDPDPNSANSLYNVWKEKYPGTDDNVEDGDDAEEMEYFSAFRNVAVGKNIKFFQTSYDQDLGGWGYYCYYYYWNRHNDNGVNGVMGPMEFAVVRNNVYKLAVTKIERLGHPRISANDPDKPDPNTPDEKDDVYISVTCTVLPWVVRENNIVLH